MSGHLVINRYERLNTLDHIIFIHETRGIENILIYNTNEKQLLGIKLMRSAETKEDIRLPFIQVALVVIRFIVQVSMRHEKIH